MSGFNPDRLFQTPFADPQGGPLGVSYPWQKWLQEMDLRTRKALNIAGQIASAAVVQGRTEGIGTTVQNLNASGKLGATGVNFNLDGVPNGTRAAWDTTTQKGAAVDASGNLLLKNITQVVGTTPGPNTNSVTYVDLAEMTVTITTKGNPVIIVFSGVGTTNGVGYYVIVRDGSNISPEFQTAAASLIPVSVSYLDQPTAASHTYKIQFKVDNIAHTFQFGGALRTLQVVELG